MMSINQCGLIGAKISLKLCMINFVNPKFIDGRLPEFQGKVKMTDKQVSNNRKKFHQTTLQKPSVLNILTFSVGYAR